MPAPVLRHYRAQAHSSANTAVTVAPVVPSARALVVSKLTVVNYSNVAHTLDLFVGAVASGDYVAGVLVLGPGEVYTETGLIAVAGEAIFLRVVAAGAGIACNIFGQEVDN